MFTICKLHLTRFTFISSKTQRTMTKKCSVHNLASSTIITRRKVTRIFLWNLSEKYAINGFLNFINTCTSILNFHIFKIFCRRHIAEIFEIRR